MAYEPAMLGWIEILLALQIKKPMPHHVLHAAKNPECQTTNTPYLKVVGISYCIRLNRRLGRLWCTDKLIITNNSVYFRSPLLPTGTRVSHQESVQ